MRTRIKKALPLLLALVLLCAATAAYRHHKYITSDDYIFRDLLVALTEVPNGDKYESMDFRVYGQAPHSYLKLYFRADALTNEEFQALGYAIMERIDRYIYIGMELPTGAKMFSDTGEFFLSFVLWNAGGERDDVFYFNRQREERDGFQQFRWQYGLVSDDNAKEMDGFYIYPILTPEQYALWGNGEPWQ